jgi:Holliday junction resolvase-like predicted endonuclease|tara:strand:- start:506 stop:829 length:324 start_codon:yes stop_codon:yes gene_type:complete
MKHIKHSNSRVGDLSEFYAVTWLWDNGYEVFLNAGTQGPIDLIAYKDGNATLIDVKTESHDPRKEGNYYCTHQVRTELQKELGVKLLGYNPATRQLRFVEHRNEKSD